MRHLRALNKRGYKSLPTNSGLKLTILHSKICNKPWSGRREGIDALSAIRTMLTTNMAHTSHEHTGTPRCDTRQNNDAQQNGL
jgi:hypothetical protein